MDYVKLQMKTPNRQGPVQVFVEATMCDGCGVLVADQDRHDRWHDSIRVIGQRADRADSMTRPIGGS